MVPAAMAPTTARRDGVVVSSLMISSSFTTHDTCSMTSTSQSGVSTITSWPALVVSKVRQVLSALHSASALSKAGCGYFAARDIGLLRHLLARAGELDR